MKWIEMIHIRSNSDGAREQIRSAFYELEHTEKPKFLLCFQLFQNLMVNDDLAVFLYWSSDVPRERTSTFGMNLASFFSEFGWINHVSWALDRSTQNERG